MQNSLEKFGVKNCEKAFFAILVDVPKEQTAVLKNSLALIGSESADLNAHLHFQELEQVMTVFDLKAKEKDLPMSNAVLTSIYNRLALKNL